MKIGIIVLAALLFLTGLAQPIFVAALTDEYSIDGPFNDPTYAAHFNNAPSDYMALLHKSEISKLCWNTCISEAIISKFSTVFGVENIHKRQFF
ncbi:MAG TPA: hypothetical protein VNI77_06585 [Nitrososphaera sp.]|nr:hypothetical protein [Nitrososphaera sp.]